MPQTDRFSSNYTILTDRPKIEIHEDASFLQEVVFHEEHGDEFGYVRYRNCYDCGKKVEEMQYRSIDHDSVGSRQFPCVC